MAAVSAGSASMAATPTSFGSQAEPLPSKRGEIGYTEGQIVDTRAESPIQSLPAHHPADRDALEPIDSSAPHSPPTPSTGKANFISRLKRKKLPSIYGMQILTLILTLLQFALIGGTVAAWALALKRINRDNNSPIDSGTAGASTSILIHVIFGIAVIGQMVMLERRIFRLRAEWYTHVHPGEILPAHRRLGSSSSIRPMAFAPWNRPPLPTYAATLVASGHGTGDVEDHIIATPPPPAYGNTRGSVLVLSGYLRNSLRIERPPSVHTDSSQRTYLSPTSAERPKSYTSSDEQWEEICDAERALALEATLARLEEDRVDRPAAAMLRIQN